MSIVGRNGITFFELDFPTLSRCIDASRRLKQNFLNGFNTIWVVHSQNEKYSASQLSQISSYVVPLPARQRGAFRDRRGRWAGSGGREVPEDERRFSDGEVVWSWHLDAGVKLATMPAHRACDSGKKARSLGSTKETVKTIARGKPDRSDFTCGD